MDIGEIFQNKIVIATCSTVFGIFVTWITQQILNKRAVFSYSVSHRRVGVSTDDVIFGSVRVTLNGNEVPNLYLSTIEIRNESSNDYENVDIRAYSNDTLLLSEQTQIDETSYILEWSDKYKKDLHLADGQDVSQAQRDLYNRQREFNVPAINRGQIIKLTFLNSATVNTDPSIWVGIQKKGIKLAFRRPLNTIHGESQPDAAVVGVIIGFLIGAVLIANDTVLWQAVCVAMIYGLIAQIPGAYFLKLWHKFREFIGG